MNFEQDKSFEKYGKALGFVFSYFLFTTILFFILTFTKKIGEYTYWHVLGLTLTILIIGVLLEKWLKS